MASRFSGALQLTDLDDFITPSQVNNLKHIFFTKFPIKRSPNNF